MEEKFDKLVELVERMFTKWLEDFERQPVRMAVKIAIIVYLLRWAKRNLR